MAMYRDHLPTLDGGTFLTDAGLETDLIFNHGVPIPEFAAHTLLPDPSGRAALTRYLEGFLTLARDTGSGFVLDTQTWKAHPHWAEDLGQSRDELRAANVAAVDFALGLRDKFAGNTGPILINGLIGPRGDAYAPDDIIPASAAQAYHGEQIGWLAETDADMVTALTFTQSSEAIGAVRAAVAVGLPIVVSFTLETDGCLPTGQPLGEAIAEVDAATDGAAAYFMVNCAHPDHFPAGLGDLDNSHRIRGLRCNASRASHAELDAAETLDDGDPQDFAQGYQALRGVLPSLTVFGGCCGSDLRHVTAVARLLQS
ncbi:homocysteine S-methyltransferase [Hamadaea flava]|uniref:Homocysteine S-methyltransferase family protein n=1 Tax=Hamadaea flava TaxID=1742688 RepID=A0ABV8LN22_9ACTN|nr:homocysteine S-methyltransferase family protein [Hamadaea flava]MCP2324207.1 homocysteine S-methyltransferase [Hamadaea flava]